MFETRDFNTSDTALKFSKRLVSDRILDFCVQFAFDGLDAQALADDGTSYIACGDEDGLIDRAGGEPCTNNPVLWKRILPTSEANSLRMASISAVVLSKATGSVASTGVSICKNAAVPVPAGFFAKEVSTAVTMRNLLVFY
jgi:hypothetical protein